MKNVKYILISFLFIFAFSCSKEDEPNKDIDNNTGNEIENDLHFSVENEEATVTWLGSKEEVFVPSSVEINDTIYPVTTIGSRACNNDVKILHLPPTIKRINELAFVIDSLEAVYIEDIAAWCNIDFDYSVNAGNTFVDYSTHACPFRTETKLYVNNKCIDTLVIPDTVKKISHFAFMNLNCDRIEIGDEVETIGTQAFMGSTVKELILGEKVEIIEQEAFSDCANLSILELSKSLKAVHNNAFHRSNPSKIYAPDWEAWLNIHYVWAQLDGVYISPKLSNSYDLFIGGKQMINVSLPPVVPELNTLCFAGANIKNIVLEEGITSVNNWIFLNCRELETIVLPSTLEESGLSFFNCYNLREVWSYCNVPQKVYRYDWDIYGYQSTCPQAVLYVPEIYIENYKKDPFWSNFKEILPIP